MLVDAPCSGTGTWRRNPETRWRLDAGAARPADRAPGRLLDLGATLLRPGGMLVYAVCSLLAEEGRDQAEALDRPFIAGSGAAAYRRRDAPPAPGLLLSPAPGRDGRLFRRALASAMLERRATW